MVKDQSYDDTQRNAVLVTCAQCGKAVYMTHPKPVCQRCRG